MEIPIYFLDNMVACSRSFTPYISLDFVRDNCAVIDEIIYESRKSKSAENIKKLHRFTTAEDVEALKLITEQSIVKYGILKLYEGCADALLLATAITIKQTPSGQKSFFDPNTPVIVTEEKALRKACDDLKIQWLSQRDFIELIKTTQLQELPLEL